MNTFDMVKNKLSLVPISGLQKVADETGVPFGTLFKIKYKTTKNPRWETVEKLAIWAKKRRAA